MKPWILLLGATLLPACAGPTTPLGAVWTISSLGGKTPDEVYSLKTQSKVLNTEKEQVPKIDFHPSRQILHSKVNFKVEIDDSSGDLENESYKLIVRYNGLDVTETFLRQSTVSVDLPHHKMLIENPNLRLSPGTDHVIEVFYETSNGITGYGTYDPPSCYAFRAQHVKTVGPFDVDPAVLKSIDEISSEAGFNPSMITALVAQESAFDPTRVSWARAVGLTQVTPIAESEVAGLFRNWPRYQRLNRLPAPLIRALILTGTANAKNEWRLDRTRSIRGGVAFARLLAERWSTKENLSRIDLIFDNPEMAHTKLILASYHSGYGRVSAAVERLGKNWLKDPSLREARKYVNRIFSYCDYFSEGETNYEKAS